MANEITFVLDQCTTCGEVINTNESSHKERVRSVRGDERIAFKKYLRDILLAADAGHMEKNLLLALFTVWKPILFNVISKKIGSMSKNAQDFVTNVGGYHVS